MAEVTIANSLTELQANVWNLLKSDTTLLGYTKNILDGLPLGVTRKIGFPFIIVPTPSMSDDFFTLSKNKSTATFNIEIHTKKESISRLIADRVRSLCDTNKGTFRDTYGMFHYLNSNVSLDYDFDEDDGSVVYVLTLSMRYEWVAW